MIVLIRTVEFSCKDLWNLEVIKWKGRAEPFRPVKQSLDAHIIASGMGYIIDPSFLRAYRKSPAATNSPTMTRKGE